MPADPVRDDKIRGGRDQEYKEIFVMHIFSDEIKQLSM